MIFGKPIFRTGAIFCVSLLTQKTNQPAEEGKRSEGWNRVYIAFTRDEFGTLSTEVGNILHTICMSAFVGACYGGFIRSREAYMSFIERNQATSFVDHYEAKKKLQDHVTLNFAKGALKWSWRLALFGGLYTTIVTALTAYRGDTSLLDYTLGGALSGGIYRMNFGMRGVIIGASLGSLVGLFAGSFTLLILRYTETSLDDVNEYRYEISKSRDRHFNEALAKSDDRRTDTSLLRYHDELLKEKEK